MGIVGFGAIGQAVACRAQGFGMRMLTFDIQEDYVVAKELGAMFTDLDTILDQVDLMTLHLPL